MTTTTTTDAALGLLASLVLEDGRRWGDAATDAQLDDARAVLTVGSPTPRHWISRARGYSKTTDAGGWLLAAMLSQLGPGSRAYALSSDRDQSRLLLDSMRAFVSRTPGLGGAVTFGAYRAAIPATDVVLELLAADAPGAWGLRPAFVLVDELCQWNPTPTARTLYEAVVTALPKVGGSRLAIITTSGDPASWSHKVYANALADPLWRVSEQQGPAPWMSAKLLDAERRRLPESAYRRLFENEWTAPEDRLVTTENLAAAVRLDGPQEAQPNRSYVIGLDVGTVNDRTVAAVCHREGDEVFLDRIEVWAGSRRHPVDLAVVQGWVTEAARSYNRARVVYDPFQAVQLAQGLRAADVAAREFTFSAQSVGKLGLTLYQLLRAQRLALPDDEELLAELGRVQLRETAPGVYRLDHAHGEHDDRAIALALAATELVSRDDGGGSSDWSPSVLIAGNDWFGPGGDGDDWRERWMA